MKRIFTILCFAIVGTYATAQISYFQTDFEEGLPADWVIENDSLGWALGDAAALSSQFWTIPDIGEGQLLAFNDDGLGNEHMGGGTVTSGVIDLSEVTGDAILEMHSFFVNGAYGEGEAGLINVSTDGGVSWNALAMMEPLGGFEVFIVDFSDYLGEMVTLQFVYDDGDAWNFGWAIDNVKISSEVTLIPQRAFAINAGPAGEIDEAADGAEYKHQGWVINNGIQDINSYDVIYSNGSETFTHSVSGIAIPIEGFHKFVADETITVSGNQEWTITLSNVNGSMEADETPNDDAASFNLNAVQNINPDKGVLVEEGTGTWCPWCTRGTTFLDEMSARFPDNFAGIAVHNGDPMTLAEYDSALGSLIGGYPSTIFERDAELDPAEIVNPTLSALQTSPLAALTIGAELNGNSLTTSLEANFLEGVTDADYNVLIAVTLDNVTGEGPTWNQANAYAGGANGTMGGYELLPNSIPGLDYDHVGIGLIGEFDGVSDVITGDFSVGSAKGNIFETWNLPSGTVIEDVHLVGILLDANGDAINVVSSSIDEAINEGLTTATVNVEEIENVTFSGVYPNPVLNNAFINLNILQPSNVSVSVTNALGQVVLTEDFGTLSGSSQLEIDMSSSTAGFYTISAQIGEDTFTQKITK